MENTTTAPAASAEPEQKPYHVWRRPTFVVAESTRDRDGQGYSSELRFYGVFCRETGDMIYYETGREMMFDRGGRQDSGATDVSIRDGKVLVRYAEYRDAERPLPIAVGLSKDGACAVPMRGASSLTICAAVMLEFADKKEWMPRQKTRMQQRNRVGDVIDYDPHPLRYTAGSKELQELKPN